MTTERVLLPTNVVPSKYKVSLAPSFTDFKVPGSEEIAIEVKEATTSIQVHAKEITIHSAEFSTDKVKIAATYPNTIIFYINDPVHHTYSKS